MSLTLAQAQAQSKSSSVTLAQASATQPTPPLTADSVWSNIATQQPQVDKVTGKPLDAFSRFVQSAASAVTAGEQGAAGEIAAGLPASVTGEDLLNKANQDNASSDVAYIKAINTKKAAGQPITKQQQEIYDHILQTNSSVGTQADLLPHANDTNLQAIGNVVQTGADILSAGTYGAAAKEAETGILLAKQAATPVAKVGLAQTLKNIALKTAARAGIGAGTGYTYDVANNLQEGKTGGEALTPGMGTLIGGVAPILVGGVQAGAAFTKDSAPRFINSLIKPKQADFSYGKDPGRTVAELGITGNSLPDFANNITTAKQEIGNQIGAIYSAPENASIRIDATPEITKIDDAIAEAAKGGRGNQAIVTALQNTKDALLYEHQVNADGVIEKVGTTPRDLTNLTPQEAFDLKSLVAQQTKFTGNPSDDKTVNSILKNIYGGIKEKLNTLVGANNPELTDLNQKYADLTSAELATHNRDAIVKRADVISMPIKVGGATAIISALATGGAAVPAILAGATAAALDKALESTAVKTRVAAWLGSQSPSAIGKILEQNPEIKTVLIRALPKLSSLLGKDNSTQ